MNKKTLSSQTARDFVLKTCEVKLPLSSFYILRGENINYVIVLCS